MLHACGAINRHFALPPIASGGGVCCLHAGQMQIASKFKTQSRARPGQCTKVYVDRVEVCVCVCVCLIYCQFRLDGLEMWTTLDQFFSAKKTQNTPTNSFPGRQALRWGMHVEHVCNISARSLCQKCRGH